MLDHVSLHVSDYIKSKDFYIKALEPLGYKLMMEYPNVGGFGIAGKADFWISQKEDARATHIAFMAESRPQVDEFYKNALALGGKDNGAPGIRTDYSPTYYAAFVIDPDGNNIEVVCHQSSV